MCRVQPLRRGRHLIGGRLDIPLQHRGLRAPREGRIRGGDVGHGATQRIHEQRRLAAAGRPLPDGGSPLLNPTRPGDILPAIIVRVWDDGSINAQVLLDGELTLWVTSRHFGDNGGTWRWPERAAG